MKTLAKPSPSFLNGIQTIGSREASNNFGRLLNTTVQGQPFIVTRNNHPEAVLIPLNYFELMGGEKLLFEKIAEDLQAKRERLIKITHDIQDEAKKKAHYKINNKQLSQKMDRLSDKAVNNGMTSEILEDIF
jgi:prevent-host-death family protein